MKGELIEIGTDYSRPCTPQYLACSYKSLPTTVGPGSKILVADGSLMLEVQECRETSVIAKIMNNAALGDRKNMNLPGELSMTVAVTNSTFPFSHFDVARQSHHLKNAVV